MCSLRFLGSCPLARKNRMRRAISIAVLVLVTIAFAISLTLFQQITPVTSPSFVFLAMFVFMGWIAFARPLLVLPIPPPFRRLHKWEYAGAIYRHTGSIWFGHILRTTHLRYLQPLVYLNQKSLTPREVWRQIEGAEAVHWWAIVLTLPYLVYATVIGEIEIVGFFLIAHLGLHLYPIMHLRHVRTRMDRHFEKKATRSGRSSASEMTEPHSPAR